MTKAHEELLDIFKKKNSDYGNSFFDGRGRKFKSVVQDIIRFDPNMIITESITFNNILQPDVILFNVNNTRKFIKWWYNNEYSKKSNYVCTYTYHNEIGDNKPGSISIHIKENDFDVRFK